MRLPGPDSEPQCGRVQSKHAAWTSADSASARSASLSHLSFPPKPSENHGERSAQDYNGRSHDDTNRRAIPVLKRRLFSEICQNRGGNIRGLRDLGIIATEARQIDPAPVRVFVLADEVLVFNPSRSWAFNGDDGRV